MTQHNTRDAGDAPANATHRAPATTPARERIATIGAFFANGLGIGAWAAEIPRIKEHLGLSDTLLGIALLSFAAGAIIAMPMAGRVALRLGTPRSTLLASLAFVVLLGLPGFAPSLPVIMAALFVLGMSNGSMDVLMNGHASYIETRWGKAIMSSFHAAWSFGGLLGASLGGFIAKSGFSVGAGLALPAVASAVIVIASAIIGLKPGFEAPPVHHEKVPFTFRNRLLLLLGAVAFLSMVTEGSVTDWSGVYLRTIAHGTAAEAALGYASFAFAMTACRLIGDLFVRRFGQQAMMWIGGGLSAIGFLIVIAVPQVVIGCAGYVLIGVGLSNLVPIIFSAAGRAGATPAIGVSMAATAGYAGFLIGPPIIGFCADMLGMRIAFLLLLVAACAIAIVGGRVVGETPALTQAEPDAAPGAACTPQTH
ncbi:MFS transporter [Pararobbsia alpina]|uniref:MFS transporter n=1 Tax=Pararobbsia alpina TaxID=621374 RepID=UPI0039A4715B